MHFEAAGVDPNQIHQVQDLERIPAITKEDIRRNKDAFIPKGAYQRYYVRNTGGTTGTPLTYRISRYDRFLSAALLYRGWSAAGYKLGDKMLFLAGSSLMPDIESGITNRMNEIVRNTKFLSSFEMSERNLSRYTDILNSWKPYFLRGYPSALCEFADYIASNNLTTPSIKAVFTTSEKLFPTMRKKIEETLNSRIFDGYGANDGGLSSFECDHGNMHIDTERSILEIVDDENCQIQDGTGNILATSLQNYAMPLIRYRVGDRAVATSEICSCGRGLTIMREIDGRTVSVFVTPNDELVHGWFFQHIFWEIGESVEKYKVVQKSKELIEINIVPGDGFSEETIRRIRGFIEPKSKDWTIDIKLVDSIPKPHSGKTIYIESEIR